MAEVFISCASASKAEAERVAGAIRALGYSVWRDDELPPHRAYSEVIEERLRAARAVVVVWSKAAAASQWVRAEADLARQEGKLVQVVVDGSLPPLPFNQIQCADLTGWKGEAEHAQWRKVAASLADLLETPQPRAEAGVSKAAPKPWIWAAAGLVLLALVAGGLWAARDSLTFLGQPAPVRVAVLPFDAVGGDGEMQAFADGLLDETLAALTTDRVQALSRTDSLALRGSQADQAMKRRGIGLFLDGTVRKDGDQIKVRVTLNDARDHTTLWSTDYERSATEADALQAQVAARVADNVHWALMGRNGGHLDPATLAAFVRGEDGFLNDPGSTEPLMRQVLAKAPTFARAHSMLALSTGKSRPDETGDELLAEKKAEARKALQLDPHDGEPYLVLTMGYPPGSWRQVGDLLEQSVAAEPDLPYTHHFLNKFYSWVGRNQDALAQAQRTAALNFMFVGGGTDPCIRLTNQGRLDDAKPICERADRLWPHDMFNIEQQLFLEAGSGRTQEALQRLQRPDFRSNFGPGGFALWDRFLRARLAGDAAGAKSAALAMAKAADAGEFYRTHAYFMLALTGQTDAALAQAAHFLTGPPVRGLTGDEEVDGSILFFPSTASVRRDPRFMAAAAAMKLTDYCGVWPDFCAEPGLPYDCKAEAAKLKAPRA